jgi:isoleucyl-tRNA synthetase
VTYPGETSSPAAQGAPGERYRLLPADQPADEIERELLDRWKRERLFERTLEQTAAAQRWVFFEGPPTANGRPGIHHVFSRTIKDLFCRHRAMHGLHVLRKAGWDTHGLPVEIEVERQLGISGKQQIEEIGVERFNQLCRESVFTYREEWERLSERIAFWLDYERPYVTYSNDYVESIWWALKTLYDKGLLYQGHKILPYCPRCGTSLSSHEVAQGYETVTDPSVYVALPLADDSGRRLLVWTTTPWTLVANVALAVHPDLEYVELVRRDGDGGSLVLAVSRAEAVLGADYTDRWRTVRILPGRELAGLRYARPLDWVEFDTGVREIVVAEDFVSAEDGSGIVHMAPAFGADDYLAGQRHGLAFVQPVDAAGNFAAELPLVGGKWVKDADHHIIDELRSRGMLWKAGTIEHSYPHCWRCSTPLLYYARSSWFVRTTAYRDQMLARNARVAWHPPEVGEGRFGEWLSNNVDWAISRDRYWGTPLPLWVCDTDDSHREAVGSFEELASRIGRPLGDDFDPHKPYVDAYAWPCAECGGTMHRVSEVIDTWFDSGSMSFAQWHYPFENRDHTAAQYPADFIAEGVDQTRGWFYSLLAIATGLGDALPNNDPAGQGSGFTAPYRSVVVNDLLLDSEGQKMSKSRGNVVDPWTMMERHGADAVRLSLLAVSQVWIPRRFDENVIREHAGRFLVTLKNVYSGIFALYANFGWRPSQADPAPAARPLTDRWILSRTTSVERQVDELLTSFDATAAARAVTTFVVDDLANWYIRLNRHRFYEVDGADNRAAFATLHEVLCVVCRLLAPFAPFLSDWIHRELAGESVHLARFVRGGAQDADPLLESGMGTVRTLARLGRAAREEAAVRVRQPLSRLVCVVPEGMRAAVQPLAGLLATELNVKLVEFASSADALVELEAKPNFRALGKRFGRSTPLAAAAVSALDGTALRGLEAGDPVYITVEGETHALADEEVTIIRRAAGDLVVCAEGQYFAAIDPSVTPELRLEGLARELVSRVQRLRKESGFAVSDRIALGVWGDPEVESAAGSHSAWISEEVLARELAVGGPPNTNEPVHAVELDGLSANLTVRRLE